MAQDVMSHWVQKTKSMHEATSGADAPKGEGVKVVRRKEPKTKGEIIMDIADKIWPSLMKLFANVHDEEGLLMQPAHVRGIALNVAQDLVNNNDGTKAA